VDPFQALEHDDLDSLRGQLADGLDPNTERDGMSLLDRAYDVASDGEAQVGAAFHVDAIALLLAWGADPRRSPLTAQRALLENRWLVLDLFHRLTARGQSDKPWLR
jgi:hypothetical protein